MKPSKNNSSDSPPEVEDPNGPKIPDYEVLRRIGKGGYGEVFLARSVTGNLRAVKVVRRTNFESERAFEREFEGIQHYEKVAQDHPGLVDILHVGRDDEQGFYFYVMELADDIKSGRDIDIDSYVALTLSYKLKSNEKIRLNGCVELGQNLSGALGELHRNKLSHRDVKPSNIIYVKGKPRLADPGLVARSGQNTFVGTEGYVPPEGPGTPQADLYSLGMVLYEMNTGKDRMDFPELPTIVDPDEVHLTERRELNTVICKACAPRPKQRYLDAKAFYQAISLIGTGKKQRAAAALPWKMAAAALLALTLIGVSIGGVFLGGDTETKDPVAQNPDLETPSKATTEVTDPPTEPATPVLASAEQPQAQGTEVEVDPTQETVAVSEVGNPTPPVADPTATVTTTTGEDSQPVTLAGDPGKPDDPEVLEAAKLDPPVSEETGAASEVTEPAPVVADTTTTPPAADTEEPNMTETTEPPAAEQAPAEEGTIEVASVDPKAMVSPTEDPAPATKTPKTGTLRVMSYPADAIVYINDREEGTTPRDLPLPEGEYRIRVELKGYRDFNTLASVKPNELTPVEAPLPVWRPPSKGQMWSNSFKMEFLPNSPDSGHRSTRVVPQAPFDQFAKVAQLDEDSFRVANEVVYATPQARQNFCSWLTKQDRAKGYLDERVYMHEAKDYLDGSPNLAAFALVVDEQRFGKIVFKSDPEGADIYRGEQKIGRTPFEIGGEAVGPVSFEMRKGRHEKQIVSGLVSFYEPLNLFAKLAKNDGVEFGHPWTNSLGMNLRPVGDILVAAHETTIENYDAFVAEAGDDQKSVPTTFPQGPNHPVVNLRIAQTRAFCEWLTKAEQAKLLIQPNHVYRLPTDAEWSIMAGLDDEKGNFPMARDSQVKDVFPWGTAWPPPPGTGNFKDATLGSALNIKKNILSGVNDGFVRTAPVGTFKPNKYGLFDLAGNVWEFVNDDYARKTKWPTVMRGGSWKDYSKANLETSHRNITTPDRWEPLWGFRIVLVDETPVEVELEVEDAG